MVIQEVNEPKACRSLLICEPKLVESDTLMESLALVAQVEAVDPCLVMDVKVILLPLSTRTTSTNLRSSQWDMSSIKPTPTTTSAN